MKHITFAGKNFLVGDRVADAILEYAAMLGETRSADSVDITAIDADGDVVTATLFLSPGVPLVAETTNNSLPEPDNDETTAYIEARLAQHVDPAPVQPANEVDPRRLDIDDWLDDQE